MINASFVEVRNLSARRKRKTSPYYLSGKVDGVTRLTYIKKKDLNLTRRRVLA